MSEFGITRKKVYYNNFNLLIYMTYLGLEITLLKWGFLIQVFQNCRNPCPMSGYLVLWFQNGGVQKKQTFGHFTKKMKKAQETMGKIGSGMVISRN